MFNNNITIPWGGWRLVEQVGRGQFGSVYKISATKFGITEYAAMKLISIPNDPQMIKNDYSYGYDKDSIASKYKSYLDDVLKEYQLMMKVKGCSGIVRCDDISVFPHDDGIGWDVFIRMEYLTPVINVLPDLCNEKSVIKLAMDICRALEACENANILHRDIKPSNILINEQGDFKLGDFGVSRTLENGNTYGTQGIGTYDYMAPEVFNGGKYGVSADIYSLGMVMYWMLNKRTFPFLTPGRAPTAQEISDARSKRFSGVALPNPMGCSAALSSIVLKACAFDPSARYCNATAMLSDLKKVSSITANAESEQYSVKYESYSQTNSAYTWNDTQETVGKSYSPHSYASSDTGYNNSSFYSAPAGTVAGMKETVRNSGDPNAWKDTQETVGKTYTKPKTNYADSATVGKNYAKAGTPVNNKSKTEEKTNKTTARNVVKTEAQKEKPRSIYIVCVYSVIFTYSLYSWIVGNFDSSVLMILLFLAFCLTVSIFYAIGVRKGNVSRKVSKTVFVNAAVCAAIFFIGFIAMAVNAISIMANTGVPTGNYSQYAPLAISAFITAIFVLIMKRCKKNELLLGISNTTKSSNKHY